MKTQNKNKYGLLSLMSIIIGTVIGSGIYFKNDGLMSTSNSAILTMIAWTIGGLIVVSLLIAFFEITTIALKKNEQGTMNNIGNHLFNPTVGRFIGFFYAFIYFPYVVAAYGGYSSQKLLLIFDIQDNIQPWIMWLIITIMASIVICISVSMVMFSVNGTKNTMKVSSLLKTIPLIFVIFFVFLAFVGLIIPNSTISNGELNSAFDPNDELMNSGLKEGAFLNTMLILPPMMFAFDGFLFTTTLSEETKKKSHLKIAAISSILIIILLYILYSLSTLLAGDATNQLFGLDSVIKNLIPGKAGEVLATLGMMIIVISVLSAALGKTTLGTWTLASSSASKEIPDNKGLAIRRSKNGIPRNATMILLITAFLWLFIFRLSDGIYIILGLQDGASVAGIDYITNLGALTNFGIYAILAFGGILNRISKKNEVEKINGFVIFASIAILLVSIVLISGYYDVVNNILNGEKGSYLELGMLLIFYGYYFGGSLLNEYFINKKSDDNGRNQEIINYHNHVVYEKTKISKIVYE